MSNSIQEQKFDQSFLDKNLEKTMSTMMGGKKKRSKSKTSKKSKSKKTTKISKRRKMRGGGFTEEYIQFLTPYDFEKVEIIENGTKMKISCHGNEMHFTAPNLSSINPMTTITYINPPLNNTIEKIQFGLIEDRLNKFKEACDGYPHNNGLGYNMPPKYPRVNNEQVVGGKKKKRTTKSKSKSKTSKSKTTKKKSTKSHKGGFKTRIHYMSDSAVNGVQKLVGTTVNGLNSFMNQLENKFEQSVKAAESVKIGDQRLIHNGGAKKKKSKTSKSKKTTKKSTKKSTKKKTTKRRKMRGGSTGSDFALTLNSRGPANYPDNGWFNGKQLFHTFTKTGDYIPNSQLPYAAAPISTLSNPNPQNIITGYDNLGQQWEPVKH